MFPKKLTAVFLALALFTYWTVTKAEEPKAGREIELNAVDGAQQTTNSIGVKFAFIPPGEFMMGSSESADAKSTFFKESYQMGLMKSDQFSNEHPQHRVRISKAFYFGIYPVTRGQFRAFIEDTGYKTVAERGERHVPGVFGFDPSKNMYSFMKDNSWRNPGYEQDDDHPAVAIAWIDATAFCEWLSKKEGKSYRLPTEAEWEYACRAGTRTRYHSGDDPETLATAANIGDVTAAAKFERFGWALNTSDGELFTSEVGRYQPNAFGLYDMHGNVWQWCSDWYKPDYYSESPVDDPTGPGIGYRSRDRRIARGGSWYSRPWECTSSTRHWINPASQECDQIGFRVIQCVDPSDDPVKRATANRLPVTDDVQISIERINNRQIGIDDVVEVHWKLTGPLVAEIKAIRILVHESTDEDNNQLLMPDSDDGFRHTQQNQIYLKTQRPVKTVKLLRGEVHLVVPSRDPEGILTIDFTKEFSAPIKHPTLAAAVCEITFQQLQGPSNDVGARKEWSVSYKLKDPYGKIIGAPEFIDADGQSIPYYGPFGGGMGGDMSMTAVFKSKPPEGLRVKLHVASDKSLVAVPFEFKDISITQSPQ